MISDPGLSSWKRRPFKPFSVRLKRKEVGHQTVSATSFLASSAPSRPFVASTTIHISFRCLQVDRNTHEGVTNINNSIGRQVQGYTSTVLAVIQTGKCLPQGASRMPQLRTAPSGDLLTGMNDFFSYRVIFANAWITKVISVMHGLIIQRAFSQTITKTSRFL